MRPLTLISMRGHTSMRVAWGKRNRSLRQCHSLARRWGSPNGVTGGASTRCVARRIVLRRHGVMIRRPRLMKHTTRGGMHLSASRLFNLRSSSNRVIPSSIYVQV